jgi:hypothetical protein
MNHCAKCCRPRKVSCSRGHPLNDATVYLYRGERRCKQCNAIRVRRHRAGVIGALQLQLEAMLEELKDAEAGQRIFVTDDLGKVTNVLRQPSTFPKWLDELSVPRSKHGVERLARIIQAALDGDAIPRKNRDLWWRIRERAVRNVETEIDQLAAVSDIE